MVSVYYMDEADAYCLNGEKLDPEAQVMTDEAYAEWQAEELAAMADRYELDDLEAFGMNEIWEDRLAGEFDF